MREIAHRMVPRTAPGLLSLVIPVYNEEEMLPLLVGRLLGLLAMLPCPAEVIMVNDGSSDRTAEVLRSIAGNDSRFRVIGFARNFGHQIAATAGLDASRGDAVVLMDADLQDPPELILDMLKEYEKGYDVVYAQRKERQGESWFKNLSAWLFYRIMRMAVDRNLPPDVGDFRLVSRRCLDALNSMREMHRFLRGMVSWVGFPQTSVTFVRPARAAGSTKYPLRKMLSFAWTAAVSFSPAPLRLVAILGLMMLAVGVIYGAYVFAYWIEGGRLVPGWTSLTILIFVSTGAVMISIAILGEYVARIFEEIKRRPLYIVSERWNFGSDLDHELETSGGKSGHAVAESAIPRL